jgi:hypothetical protein
MSDTLKIDPEAVEQASADVIALTEELETAALKLGDGTSNALSGIEIGPFAFRTALTDAVAFWARRAAGCRERLTDAAQFMATNAAIARELDEDSAAGFVELGSDMYIGVDQYTRDDYYERTGAERPAPSGEDGSMAADGESVAVG